jgi:hypothetical protein
MIIPIELFNNIMGFMTLTELALMDTAFLSKVNRPRFLEMLKQQKNAELISHDIIFQINFIKWIKLRQFYFEKVTFYRPTMYILNSIVCIMQHTLCSLNIRGNMSRDSMLIISLLCKNLKEIRYRSDEDRIDVDEDGEQDVPDLFREMDFDIMKNLQSISVRNCSNYGLLLLTLYAKNLKYLKIENVRGLNENLLYDMVLFLSNCEIDIDLVSSLRVATVVTSKKRKKLNRFILEVNSNDANIRNDSMLRRLFYHNTDLEKLVLDAFIYMEQVEVFLRHINKIDSLVLRGRLSLDGLLYVLRAKKVSLLKLVFLSNPMNLCVDNLISFLKDWEEQENYEVINIRYLDISIEYNNFGVAPVEFDKNVLLIQLIEKRMRSGVKVKINHKILRLDNNFWKNDVIQIII